MWCNQLIYVVYHIVNPYNLNGIHKRPHDNVHNHNKHYHKDLDDKLKQNIIFFSLT